MLYIQVLQSFYESEGDAMNNTSYAVHFFRTLGIALIILAHINPPDVIFQIRNFDVILLVCLSSLSFFLFSRPENYLSYFRGRIVRLVFPAWGYIFMLTAAQLTAARVTGEAPLFSLRDMLIAMFTFTGPDYLWVIRVFLYIALLNPLFGKIMPCRKTAAAVTAGGFCLYYLLCALLKNVAYPGCFYLEITVLHFAGYGLTALAGMYVYFLKKAEYLLASAGVFAVIFALCCYFNCSLQIQNYKYPPQMMYISYGLMWCSVIFYLIRRESLWGKYRSAAIVWFSKNSLWIYFYHALLLTLMKGYSFGQRYLSLNWAVKYLLIVAASVLLCQVHNFLAARIKSMTAYLFSGRRTVI